MLSVLAAAAIVLAQAVPSAPVDPSKVVVTATPAEDAAPAVSGVGAVKPKKPKMICHDEIVTGSIMSKRVCRTPEQVEADRQQARRDNDALSDHLAACHGASC